MEDSDIIYGLCSFYESIEDVYDKYNNNEITSEEAMKNVGNILSTYYSEYSNGTCRI